MPFIAGQPRHPNAGRRKGTLNKPKSIEKILAKLVEKAIAKQATKSGLAECMPPNTAPLQNQKSSKLAKARRQQIPDEREFIAQQGNIHPLSSLGSMPRRVPEQYRQTLGDVVRQGGYPKAAHPTSGGKSNGGGHLVER